jgi:hypothetical protein
VVPEVILIRSGGSSDDDTLDRPEYIWSVTKGVNRRNNAWKRRLADSALALPTPEPEPEPERKPTPVSSDTEDGPDMTEDQKRYARHAKKKSAMALKFEDNPATMSRAVAEPSTLIPAVGISKQVTKAAASQRAPGWRRQQTNQKEQRPHPQLTSNRLPNLQWLPEVKRAELEACDQGAVQGKRIRVLHKATLPKPKS